MWEWHCLFIIFDWIITYYLLNLVRVEISLGVFLYVKPSIVRTQIRTEE